MLLQNRLALHRFICREFGYEGLPAMLERLRDAPAGFTGSGESEYARALYLNPNLAAVTPDRLLAYDANIAAHSRKLRMNGEQGREWKPYQYLALLFTERYLVSARKPLYRSFPVTIHHTFRASCSPISSRKMPAIGLGGVIGGGPAPIFGTRP